MKKLVLVVAILFAGYVYFGNPNTNESNGASTSVAQQNTNESDAVIANAFANHESNLQVSGQGVVVKLLPDDNSGSRHQKIILKLDAGQTLLVAHNIDIAPRVDSIREGDAIQFEGEYEWNEKGGVIHWTHRDPNGTHPAGWLKHQGKTYQ